MPHTTRLTIVTISTLLLSACGGFHLRGSGPDVSLAAISPLRLLGLPQTAGLYPALREELRAADVALTEFQESAAATLALSGHRIDKRIHSVDDKGKVLEYELIEEFSYTLTGNTTARGERRGHGTLRARRVYTNPETTEVLGRRNEEETLRKEMRRELAQNLIRRLSRLLHP